MTASPVVCDLRAIQSPDHRGRGIGRWSYEFATALEGVRPDLVSAYLLDPCWPPPGAVDELLSSRKLCYLGSGAAEKALAEARVYHCFSATELSLPISAVRPRYVDEQGMAYAAVAYDLIPLRAPEEYLVHPAQRRRYRARLEVLRAADALLAISPAAAADVTELLGVGPDRCHVVGTGVSHHFRPPARRDEALASLARSMPEITGPFVLYPGGNDGRKNISGLIEAFSELPPAVRDRYHLVVVGDLPPLTANHYHHLARLAGIEERLVLTGFVSDDRLADLYRATDLFVFPSFAEGFGLPIAEALASGAVAAVSDRAPFDSLVPVAAARFDPHSPKDMAVVIARCLLDDKVRGRVRDAARDTVDCWADVARRAGDVFEDLARRHRPGLRRSRKLAVVSPLPPTKSGVADYSERLVDAMRALAETGEAKGLQIDCFADGIGPTRRHDTPHDPAYSFVRNDGAIGGYDEVLYVLGNSEYHGWALSALRQRPGVVLTHDVRLSGLFRLSVETPGAVPGGLGQAVAAAYDKLPEELGGSGTLSEAECDRYGLLFLREVARHAPEVLVTSRAAADLAALDLGPDLSERIRVVPFGMWRLRPSELAIVEAARSRRSGDGRRYVSSFGIVDPAKQPALLIESIALLAREGADAVLRLVGRVDAEFRRELLRLADSLGAGGRVEITGEVTWEEYLAYLGSTDLAVQLRARSYGEASSAVAECLSAGTPVAVTRLGWMAELPADSVFHLAPAASPDDLALALGEILGDRAAREERATAGLAYASTRTFELAARAVLEELSRVSVLS